VIAYVDASVIVRFVMNEPRRLDEIARFDARITSALAEVECLRAIDKARLAGEYDDDEVARRRQRVFVQLRRMDRVLLTRTIVTRAGEALPVPLKALDAIHLATALVWRERRARDLVFATHDRQLGRAAAAVGFDVIGV
jgi:predicted nucleic acid-binding protein